MMNFGDENMQSTNLSSAFDLWCHMSHAMKKNTHC